MPNYRRTYVPGGTFFFTLVTLDRAPLLTTPLGRACLREAWRSTVAAAPVEMVAHCLLPDHLHCVWTLPEGDVDYSSRWRRFKGLFTREWRAAGGEEIAASESRQRRGEGSVWQRRFWEHRVRDTDDLESLLAYIHYNPVRHGWVSSPAAWPFSSFRRYVTMGWYPSDWGVSEPKSVAAMTVAGEP